MFHAGGALCDEGARLVVAARLFERMDLGKGVTVVNSAGWGTSKACRDVLHAANALRLQNVRLIIEKRRFGRRQLRVDKIIIAPECPPCRRRAPRSECAAGRSGCPAHPPATAARAPAPPPAPGSPPAQAAIATSVLSLRFRQCADHRSGCPARPPAMAARASAPPRTPADHLCRRPIRC